MMDWPTAIFGIVVVIAIALVIMVWIMEGKK